MSMGYQIPSHYFSFLFLKLILHSQLTSTSVTLGYSKNDIRIHLEYFISSSFATFSPVTCFPCAKEKESLPWGLFFQDWWNSVLHVHVIRHPGLSQRIYVFRCSIFKCATFLAADLFCCQSLNFNKLEQRFQNTVQKLKSLVPKKCQLSGVVLVFAGEVAKTMLQFAL